MNRLKNGNGNGPTATAVEDPPKKRRGRPPKVKPTEELDDDGTGVDDMELGSHLQDPKSAKDLKKAQESTKNVRIPRPNLQIAQFQIRGTAPYVQNKFSEKALNMMKAAQEAGSLAKKKGRVKEPKDFNAAYEAAMHRSVNGWHGIPAVAFYKAMVSSCRMVDFKMTVARLGLFVLPDGWSADPHDKSGLIRITKGTPARFETLVRLQMSSTDIRVRPFWEPGWEATVKVRHDADIFSTEDVANLLLRAGMQVGVGEGRPDSPSGGQGWGLFEILG